MNAFTITTTFSWIILATIASMKEVARANATDPAAVTVTLPFCFALLAVATLSEPDSHQHHPWV
jgi:hypothetical protein